VKVFLDASVIVAGLAFTGSAHALLAESFESPHEFLLSEDVQEEAVRALREGFPRLATEAREAVSILRASVLSRNRYRDAMAAFPLIRDPKDAHVLAAASESGCDLLVTWDKDLLVLRQVGTCQIVTPPRALRVLRGPRT